MLKGAKQTSVALGETLRLALDALRSHKLRSFLTLLGVILAVTTLVAVMSVVEGLNRYISDRVANLGANVFIVDRFGIITNWDEFVKAQRRPTIRVEEYEALAEKMQMAQQVAAIEGSVADVRFGNDLLEDVNLVGVTSNYAEVRSYTVAAGRFFTQADEGHRSPVCFLGADVARRFFTNVDPIGKTIRAGSQAYEVVGVAKAIGSVFGQSQDNFVLIPLGVFRKTWHAPSGSLTMFAQARHPELMEAQHLSASGGVDLGLFGRRRNRHHEYHAGKRERTDARDRHSSFARRAPSAHRHAIPGGISRARCCRRADGYPAGARDRSPGASHDADAHHDAGERRPHGAVAFHGRRAVLRHLSGGSRLATGPDRSPAR